MQPVPRTIESNEILQGDDEVVIAHGERRYRLRATRDGRLAMPGGNPVVRWLRFWSACACVLFAGYLASVPMLAGFCEAFLPAASPILEVVFIPAIFAYENVDVYERYCDWVLEWMNDSGILD